MKKPEKNVKSKKMTIFCSGYAKMVIRSRVQSDMSKGTRTIQASKTRRLCLRERGSVPL
jgi:hypothetical protein